MRLYLDTSALVKLYVDEEGSFGSLACCSGPLMRRLLGRWREIFDGASHQPGHAGRH